MRKRNAPTPRRAKRSDPAAQDPGRQLKALRQAAGLSLIEAAVRCGVHPNTLNGYETGRVAVSHVKFEGIRAILTGALSPKGAA